jgi:hypothetical protein
MTDLNWVERKFVREQNLTKADDLWQAVLTAIEGACKSFNTYYSAIGNAKVSPQNGHSILVEVAHRATQTAPMDTRRRVRILFDERTLTVTLDEHSARTVQVEADQERCFLKYGKGELTPDKFSEFALGDAFFTPRNPHAPSSPAPGSWNWE